MQIHPLIYAVLAALVGVGLAVGGVYLLVGLAWALIAGAGPFLLVAVIIFRGVIRGELLAEAAEEVE